MTLDESKETRKLAHKILDRPNGDPDDDLAMLSRQLLRADERISTLISWNDVLRGLLAKGQGDCVFCGLPAADIAKCASGFPGCARMDDIMAAPEDPKIVVLEEALAILAGHAASGKGQFFVEAGGTVDVAQYVAEAERRIMLRKENGNASEG